MKKLLLSLGTVADVVAPVASVVACGTESQTALQTSLKDEVKSYQALNVMAYTLGADKSNILIAIPESGKSFVYKSDEPTVLGVNANMITQATKQQVTAQLGSETPQAFEDRIAAIYTSVKTKLDDAIDKLTDTKGKAAMEDVMVAVAGIETTNGSTNTYSTEVDAINKAMKVIVEEAGLGNVKSHSDIERITKLGNLKFTSEVKANQDELKDLFANGFPLLLKLAKTHEGITEP